MKSDKGDSTVPLAWIVQVQTTPQIRADGEFVTVTIKQERGNGAQEILLTEEQARSLVDYLDVRLDQNRTARDRLTLLNADLVREATDYMHAVSVLFEIQPEGDCLAERKPTKDDAAYRAFIYLNDQGKLLSAALDKAKP